MSLTDLGNVLSQVVAAKPTLDVIGPVRINAPSAKSDGPGAGGSPIPAIYVSGGVIHVIEADGKDVPVPKKKEQVGVSSIVFSDDHRAAGWLVASDFCCTSYPISPTLVVYRSGKPLRRIEGDRTIFDWKFLAGGRQVAFYTGFLHGTPAQHYELRDVETGRVLGKWDGELTPKAPGWTRGMRS
jgi:hypothetical protein